MECYQVMAWPASPGQSGPPGLVGSFLSCLPFVSKGEQFSRLQGSEISFSVKYLIHSQRLDRLPEKGAYHPLEDTAGPPFSPCLSLTEVSDPFPHVT